MTLSYVPFDLMDFQEEEVERLVVQKSRLLGWEMGLGKTYGGIALDLENRGRSIEAEGESVRKTLVICPKSVIDVWDMHTMELTDLDVYILESAQKRAQFLKDIKNPNRGGYFICNWESLRSMPELQKIPFFHIIADECHRAKNRKAQQTSALKKLKSLYKSALSGTPADNKPQDLFSILQWLWPTVYKSYWAFVAAYCIMEMDIKGYRKMVGVQNVDHLREQIRPFYSRKLKKNVLKDLPDKYYSEVWVNLHPKQRVAYDQMQMTMVAWVQEHEDEIDNPLIAQAVVVQLLRLMQFAVGYMVPKVDEYGNPMFNKDKYVIDKETGEEILKKGSQMFKMIDPSSKLDALIEIIQDNEDEQIVVFSQFKPILYLLEERLKLKNISCGIYTGDTKQEDRNKIVRDFQAGNIRIFAGTMHAGGVGITLTNASTVIFFDRAWSPAINAQAEDRLHRIGQKNAVHVIHLMAKDTVDISRKQAIEQKMIWLRAILGDKIVDRIAPKLKFNLDEM